MSKNNYTLYSKMNNEEPKTIEDLVELEENESAIIEQLIEEAVAEHTVEEVAPVEEPVVEAEPEVEPVSECGPRKLGIVAGCKKLNVRKMPNRASDVVVEIVEGVNVLIDESSSTALFYKVCTEHGIEGYCMKEFIKVLH